MRKTILTTLAVLTIGGAAAGILVADAQPAQPPAAMRGPAAAGWAGCTAVVTGSRAMECGACAHSP